MTRPKTATPQPETVSPCATLKSRNAMQTIEFELEGSYVELNMLLKLTGL
jgi:hypothetical protein